MNTHSPITALDMQRGVGRGMSRASSGLFVFVLVLALASGSLFWAVRQNPRALAKSVDGELDAARSETVLDTSAASASSARAPLASGTWAGVATSLDDEGADERLDETRSVHAPSTRLAELRALCSSDPLAFDRLFASLSAGRVPTEEQFALLRVAYEQDRPAERLARASGQLAEALPLDNRAAPRAFVHFLGVRAAREVRARDTLVELTFGETPPAPLELRTRALRELVLSVSTEEFQGLTQRILALRDPALQTAGLAALDERAGPVPPSDPREDFP